MTWVRIDRTRRILNDGKGGPTEPEHALCRRIYGWNGGLWPRFLLAVYPRDGNYPDYKPEGVTITYSINEDPRRPDWNDRKASLSPELIPELIEMLQEAKVKMEEKIAYHELMIGPPPPGGWRAEQHAQDSSRDGGARKKAG